MDFFFKYWIVYRHKRIKISKKPSHILMLHFTKHDLTEQHLPFTKQNFSLLFFFFFFLVAYLSPSNFGISEQLDESSSHASVGLLESTPELCSPDNISCCTIAGSYALISNFKWTWETTKSRRDLWHVSRHS